tara:strand:- start:318 stop:1274 length:957 start_codon:yes stop_codon:yes gene_type:complete
MNKKKNNSTIISNLKDGSSIISNDNSLSKSPFDLSNISTLPNGLTFNNEIYSTNPLNTDVLTISSTIPEASIEETNPSEVSQIKDALVNMIKSASKENKIDDKTAIRKVADSIDIYWETLGKFINDGIISNKVFNKFILKLKSIVMTSNHELSNVAEVVKAIEKDVDAIIVDYWYNPFALIDNYKDTLVDAINYTKNKWEGYWKDYSPDPLERIALTARHENQSDFYNIITQKKIKIYFATLPKYMHRISDNKNINEQSIIGLFLVVAGWEDFKMGEEITSAWKKIEIENGEKPEVSNMVPEFIIEPNFKNLVFKNKS